MQLLKLRYYQQRRDLGYWVIIIAVLVFFVAQYISAVSEFHGWALAALVLAFLALYHMNRSDLGFIYTYLNKPTQQLIVNYNLLLLPVSLALAWNLRFQTATGMHLLATSLVLFRFRMKGPVFLFAGRIIPPSQFEWIAGLRKNLFVILPLLACAIILSPVKLFGTAALFLLNTVFLGFYGFFEPRVMLNPAGMNVRDFLARKVAFAVRCLVLTNLPLLLINTVFQPDLYLFNLAFLASFSLLISCMVFLKYSNYVPNQTMSFSADLLVLFACVFLPYLLPLGAYLYFSTRKKAITNLSLYLDDHS